VSSRLRSRYSFVRVNSRPLAMATFVVVAAVGAAWLMFSAGSQEKPPKAAVSPASVCSTPDAELVASRVEREPMIGAETTSSVEAGSAPAAKRETKDGAAFAIPADGEILPKIQWNFARHAGTVELALAHPLINPNGVVLDAPKRQELRKRIHETNRELETVENEMKSYRHEMVVKRAQSGAFERLPVGADGRLKQPTDPDREVEVGIVGEGADHFVFRIRWGDDPEYDTKRLEVLDAKQRAIDSLAAFVASHH
jgi:hypothetical protein